jgi:hypothetical protein
VCMYKLNLVFLEGERVSTNENQTLTLWCDSTLKKTKLRLYIHRIGDEGRVAVFAVRRSCIEGRMGHCVKFNSYKSEDEQIIGLVSPKKSCMGYQIRATKIPKLYTWITSSF